MKFFHKPNETNKKSRAKKRNEKNLETKQNKKNVFQILLLTLNFMKYFCEK
jgi:hypothetical protein